MQVSATDDNCRCLPCIRNIDNLVQDCARCLIVRCRLSFPQTCVSSPLTETVSLPLAACPIPVRVAKRSDVFNASPTATLTTESRPGSPQGLPKHGETEGRGRESYICAMASTKRRRYQFLDDLVLSWHALMDAVWCVCTARHDLCLFCFSAQPEIGKRWLVRDKEDA